MSNIRNIKRGKHITLFVVIAFLSLFSVGIAPASAANIESVTLSRDPAIVSTNSFYASPLDIISGMMVSNVYATVTVGNNEATSFRGVLQYKDGYLGTFLGTNPISVELNPYETKKFIIRLSSASEPLYLKKTLDNWIWQIVDNKTVSLQVEDTSAPTHSAPTANALGETVILDLAAERDPVPFADILVDADFTGGGGDSIIRTTFGQNLKDTADLEIYGGKLDWESGYYCRDLRVLWRNNVSHVETISGPDDFSVYYDRAVIILELPQEVEFLSSTPTPTITPYVNNGKRIAVWIFNGIDKLIIPMHTLESIDITVSEPYDFTYQSKSVLMLQMGPFEYKDDLSDLRNKPPKYNYSKWQTAPEECVWLTVASATRLSSRLSSKLEDLDYNPIFSGFPKGLEPSTFGSTVQN